MLLKPSLKNFEQYLASMWNECNCVVVWTLFGIALLTINYIKILLKNIETKIVSMYQDIKGNLIEYL